MRSRNSFIWLMVFALVMGMASAFAQKQKKRPARKAKTQDSRVYLVHADLLHFDERENPDATILNGKVHFTHQGARLYCDSAYFYEASNSFEAFGHVKMYQGDTLSLLSDYAFYDGNEQMARARYNVVLTHKKTKLFTDSLDFDRIYNNAYFFEGGKMVDAMDISNYNLERYFNDPRKACNILGAEGDQSGKGSMLDAGRMIICSNQECNRILLFWQMRLHLFQYRAYSI